MKKYVMQNLRLEDLILVTNLNKPMFDEFIMLLSNQGYSSLHDFMNETQQRKVTEILNLYFYHNFDNSLYDGIGRPYKPSVAKWYLIAWILRDAPVQRMGPILSTLEGNAVEKRIYLITETIKYVAPLLPDKASWEWPAISEVMLQRLEGSRRSLRGNIFEGIVRTHLREIFKANKLNIKVTDKEVKLNKETYDVEIIGEKRTLLMPVKTRETAGGGHANLFTRDIKQAITTARANNFECIPVVVAESWNGNLDGLGCNNLIYMNLNPNQIATFTHLLKQELEKLIPVFNTI